MIADVPAADVAAFQEYESRVLPLMARHGGRLERRVRSLDAQVEVHLISFETRSGLEAAMVDPERLESRRLLDGAGIVQRIHHVTDMAADQA